MIKSLSILLSSQCLKIKETKMSNFPELNFVTLSISNYEWWKHIGDVMPWYLPKVFYFITCERWVIKWSIIYIYMSDILLPECFAKNVKSI